MIVTTLIEELILIGDISKPLLASVEGYLSKNLHVEFFVNSNGLPSIMVSEEEPLPSTKQGDVLLEELENMEKGKYSLSF